MRTEPNWYIYILCKLKATGLFSKTRKKIPCLNKMSLFFGDGKVLLFHCIFLAHHILQCTLFKTLATSCLTSVYWLVLVKFPYLGYIKYVLCLMASSDMENWSLLWVSLDHLRLKVNARNHKTETNTHFWSNYYVCFSVTFNFSKIGLETM